MTANEMIELMNRKPFSPFEIYMADGEKVRVEYPFHIATRQNGPTAIVYDSEDRTHFISYRNITRVIIATGDQSESIPASGS